MKILYGVQGTGNGHISRARVMAKYFSLRDDVHVDFLFSGRPANEYFDMDVFGEFTTRRGVSFKVKQGQVDTLGTLKAASPVELYRDIKALDLTDYDLVINDFEPVTAWAAKRQNVPSISISHQASFYHPIPKKGDTLIDKCILSVFAPCRVNMGVHWHHFGHTIMPPFIEEQPLLKPKGGFHLVYLPFEDIEQITTMLEPLREINFVCYHPKIEAAYSSGNIAFRKPSKQYFREALQHCDGVIANAGFELSSECLRLGKALLLKPLLGQFEQASNVLTLQHMGLCKELVALSSDEVEGWLGSVGDRIEPIAFSADPTPLIDWIVAGDWSQADAICEKLWQQVKFPENVKKRLDALAS